MSTDSPLSAPTQPATDPHVFSSADAQRAARNATALAISNIATKGMQFVWQLLLARWMGAEGYGIYGTIGAMLAIGAAIPEFGMGMIVVRDIANRPRDGGRYLSAMLTMQPLLAGVGYAVLTLAAWLIGYDLHLRTLLAFAALSLLIDAMGNMCHNQLIAIERMVIPAMIAAVHILTLIVLVAVALAADTGLWGLYTATLIAGVLRAAVYWLALLRLGIRPQWPTERAVMRLLLVNGWPIAVASFLAMSYQHADKLISTALLGEAGTGQLTAAFVIVFGVNELLSTTVLVAVFPVMSRLHGGGQRAFFVLMLEKLAFFNVLVSVPIAIYTALLAVPLSDLLFGADFAKTADVLQVLIWYTVVAMIASVFAQALLIENRQRLLLVIRVGGLAVNVALNLILQPAIGVQGAAIASLCAELGVLVLILRSFTFPPDWWQRGIQHLWRLGLAAGGLAATILLLRDVHPIVAALGGAPLYLALVLLSRAIAPDDWDLMYRLAIAMPGSGVIRRYWRRDLG